MQPQGTSLLHSRLDKVVLGQYTRGDSKMELSLPSNVPRRLVKVAVYFSASVYVSVQSFHRLLCCVCLQSVYDKHLGVEFQSEIQTLARVEHLNLVKFYGYLEHGDERIVLVEYVANGTLREHLDCEFFTTSLCVRVCLCARPCVLDVAVEDICLQMGEFCRFTNDIDAGIHGNFIDLAVRLDIAIDVAHAITYLHMYTGFLLIATNLILLV